MTWEAVSGLAAVIGVINALFLVPLIGMLKWLIDRSLSSRDDAITSRFDQHDEKILALGSTIQSRMETQDERISNLKTDREDIRHVEERVTSLHQKIFQLKELMARDYVHREDWVRIEGGRDVSMRHLRKDIGSLREDLAAIRERIYKPEYQD